MLVVPGAASADTCDGLTRRSLLQVGGSAFFGLSLAGLFRARPCRTTLPKAEGGPGFGKAKSVILCSTCRAAPAISTCGTPRTTCPHNVRASSSRFRTKTSPAFKFTECCRSSRQVTDKLTLIRSMSYTPVGLFNHTAAIYQMLTGYTADKVSPSGQLEPPSPKDFPNFGCNIVRFKPPTVPMLPFVMMPRPLQESNVVGKGGTAGFLGRAYDPYTLYPPGDDMDMAKMDAHQDRRPATARRSVAETGSNAGPACARRSTKACRNSRRPRASTTWTNTTARRWAWSSRGRAREAFDLEPRSRTTARALRQEHVRPVLPAGPPADRGRHAGRRSQLAEGRQLRQPLVGRPRRPVEPHEEPVGPDARRRPVGPDRRPGRARPAERNARGRRRRIRPQPAARRQHLAATTTRTTAATTGHTATPPSSPAPASSAASSTASPTRRRRAPLENPVHPTELLATIYH